MFEKISGVQIIGCGPAGVGVLVAADRSGELVQLSNSGIHLIDRATGKIGAGGLSDLQIDSNSSAQDFVEGVNMNGAFEGIERTSEYKYLEANAANIVPLAKVGAFLKLLGRTLAQRITTERGGKLSEEKVESIIFDETKGIYTTINEKGVPIGQSHAVVLSPGGEERIHDDLVSYQDRVLTSNEVFTEEGFNKVDAILKVHPKSKVVIVGASHGAFAAANHIVEKVANLSEGAVTILARGEVKEFYESEEEAIKSRCSYTKSDICTKTGRVNRFGGLRGPAKELSRNIREGCVRNVHVVHFDGNLAENQQIKAATIVIQARGYKPRKIRIFDQFGNNIGPVLRANGQIYVDENGRIYEERNGVTFPLPGAFATGLGHGRLPSAAIGGEPSYKGAIDGVNVFQGLAGEAIVNGLVNYL